MKSFLRQIENKFLELQESVESCNECGYTMSECMCEQELDEMSTTSGVAGYNIPGAFTTEKNFKKKKFSWAAGEIKESKTPISKKHVPGHYQTIEFNEEVQNDKFPFALEETDWWNKDIEYPSRDISNSPGTSHKKDHESAKSKLGEMIDSKYERIIEGYRSFATGDEKPSKKVKNTIREIAKKLREIETLVEYNTRLKTESGVTSSAYGPATTKALTEISKRLIKISERVRSLGE